MGKLKWESHKYTLFWKDGHTSILQGSDRVDVLFKREYSDYDMLTDLLFYMAGEVSDKFEYDKEQGVWYLKR